ncbi:MAG: hypothetical protein QM473_10750, partial [Acidobacteriota bacterium]|nr:hypothetical protein [Acidobacteriota bacterium]
MARRLIVRNPARLLWTLFVFALIIAGLLAWRARPQYPPSFSDDGAATSSLAPVAPQPTQAPIETEAERKRRIAEEIAQIRAVRKALGAEDATALAKLLDEGLPADLLVPDDPERVTRQTSLIYMAADAGREDLVQLLLDRGADAGDFALDAGGNGPAAAGDAAERESEGHAHREVGTEARRGG